MNDRSGNYCETLLVTLSLNIAIRAEELAQHFGVLYNGMSGETFQSNTSLINSKSDLSKRKVHIFSKFSQNSILNSKKLNFWFV
jgi:hypothetical protein